MCAWVDESVVSSISICSSPEPKYTLAREPMEGEVPEFIVMEVQLPGIVRLKMWEGFAGDT